MGPDVHDQIDARVRIHGLVRRQGCVAKEYDGHHAKDQADSRAPGDAR